MKHIDDWIYETPTNGDENLAYAKAFFVLQRLPAMESAFARPILKQHKLFCKYIDGKTYRVTGASRLGDIWLHSDFQKNTGYEKRVSVTDCSEWSPTEE